MSLVRLLVFFVMLVYAIFSLICSSSLKIISDPNKVPENLKKFAQFRFHFFTIWNFGLQIAFLFLAITDEICKLINISTIQRSVERARQFLFSTLVLPSSLLVMTVFWSIWHIDRELIFPKAIDDIYPSWLNHTLHSLIIVPLVIEILIQFNNKNYRVSRRKAVLVILVYSTFYKILYLSVYFQHGIWLYPVYKVLNWTQRVAFILIQFAFLLGYQQVGISLLSRRKMKESRTKLN